MILFVEVDRSQLKNKGNKCKAKKSKKWELKTGGICKSFLGLCARVIEERQCCDIIYYY